MKKSKLLLLSLVMCFFIAVSAQNPEIEWVSSTQKAYWVKETKYSAVSKIDTVNAIQIFADKPLQEIDGFGGCFNELGWEALNTLSEKKRIAILQDLFSPGGSNFSYCRFPVGSSDYALSYYSFDDVPEDFTMRNFNVDRDRYILIPYIKEALKIRKDLKLWASPWSPPAWMKVNEQYTLRAGGVKDTSSTGNEMNPGKNILNNATAFKMEEEYLQAYALYFSKFIQLYKKEGVAITGLHVQNEIAYAPQWPSCTWRPEDLAFFIGKYLGPRFKSDSISTQIWLGTINYGDPNYVRTVLKYPDAAKYITGIGFQWAGKKAIGTIAKEFPQYRLMQTESECGENENNWHSAEKTWGLMKQYISNGANSYMYWNMVLEKNGKSSWGWKQNMLVSIDTATKEVIYNPEYYLMKHLSHYVMPGAHLVQTDAKQDCLAFVNGNCSTVLLIANTKDTLERIKLNVHGKEVIAELKPNSFNTFRW